MSSVLHILNGDCTRVVLEETGLAGELVVWADVLHDGPVPAGLEADELLRVRAGPLTGADARAAEAFVAGMRAANARMDRCADFDEVVIWLEHDLFDQLLLIRHLAWVSRLPQASRFRLLCIVSFHVHQIYAGHVE